MHHSQEATDTALDWCIELISQSNVLEVDAKYAILDALKDKISSGEFSPTTRVSTRGRCGQWRRRPSPDRFVVFKKISQP